MYHFQTAPVPKVPPETDNVEGDPLQIVDGPAEAELAITEGVLRVTVTLPHVVVLQSPTAPTKYCVVTVGFTVIVVDVPFETCVPPHEPVYQTQFALVPKLPLVTVNVEVEPVQISVGFDVAKVGATDGVLRVTVTFVHVVVLQSPTAPT